MAGTGRTTTQCRRPKLEAGFRKELDAEMTEELNDQIVRILRDSASREEAPCALRILLSKALEDGEKRETILTKMGELRKSVSDEQEDILLEVMDFLVGWCSPHAKL